jgi:hypothetical protein
MHRHLRPASLLLCGLITSLPAGAMTLQFDYSFDTSNFFADTQRRNVLEAAGSYFSNLITDSLTAITSGGINVFNPSLFNPANPSAALNLTSVSIAADTVRVYVGGASLAGNTLAVGGPGGYSASGFQNFLDNIEQRGQVGATSGANAVEFAPWGGAVSFNSNSSWYFDSNVATDESFSGFDFYSVALHELGHVLGIGTAASWDALVNGSLFTGAASVAEFGSSIALSGDGAHWASGTQSSSDFGLRETAMDPDIAAGQRKRFTDLDRAALDDVGWTLAATPTPTSVPLPAAVHWLLAAMLLGSATGRRTRAKQ